MLHHWVKLLSALLLAEQRKYEIKSTWAKRPNLQVSEMQSAVDSGDLFQMFQALKGYQKKNIPRGVLNKATACQNKHFRGSEQVKRENAIEYITPQKQLMSAAAACIQNQWKLRPCHSPAGRQNVYLQCVRPYCNSTILK